ncbi:hypothetical protein MLD38_029299 [Melastoma candidum]|uniref:Uncharacterized protein n=1 Tax=Melastoma candidum TaxID=119954 RepID=A0ACB9N573_9MYRT|nr:hypothetical protein MLD38_029299 [Melastoma candidum]
MQVWDNVAFDGEEAFEDSSTFVKALDSLLLDDSLKENMCPEIVGFDEEDGSKLGRNLDQEIEVVERKISHLSEKLKALHLEKAGRDARTAVRGRITPAKLLEENVLQRKGTPAKVELNRRGVSLCPAEIYSTVMRSPNLSLNRPKITANSPMIPSQSRRKSCFWNLHEIDELKVTKERMKSMAPMSLSPNQGKIAPKVQSRKQGLTSIGSKKGGKKEETVISSIQPKRLFKDAEKEKDRLGKNPVKVVVKPVRVVASRYNQSAASTARKRSLPKNEEEAGRVEKRRNSIVAGKVKRRWEIVPGEVVVYHSGMEEKAGEEDQEEEILTEAKTPLMLGEKLGGLRVPKGVTGGSPRDSGAAKRVTEPENRRAGRHSANDEDGEPGDGSSRSLSFLEAGEAK